MLGFKPGYGIFFYNDYLLKGVAQQFSLRNYFGSHKNRFVNKITNKKVTFILLSNICVGITPVEGTEETVRVVSMDKDFHVDCYICEECGMQLTDEPDKRCYPLESRLMCRSCHIERLQHTPRQMHPVAATYQYTG